MIIALPSRHGVASTPLSLKNQWEVQHRHKMAFKRSILTSEAFYTFRPNCKTQDFAIQHSQIEWSLYYPQLMLLQMLQKGYLHESNLNFAVRSIFCQNYNISQFQFLKKCLIKATQVLSNKNCTSCFARLKFYPHKCLCLKIYLL